MDQKEILNAPKAFESSLDLVALPAELMRVLIPGKIGPLPLAADEGVVDPAEDPARSLFE